MKILAACEWSGRVRDAFIAQGHDAYSCDIEESEGTYNQFHIRDDGEYDDRQYALESIERAVN